MRSTRWSPDGQSIAVTQETADGRVTAAIVSTDGATVRILTTGDPTLSLGCGAWSPDGKRLACEGWDDSDPTRNGAYIISSTDGSGLTRVTTSPDGGHDIPGSFSPDGSQISFVRSVISDHGQLFVVPAVGGVERQATTTDTFSSAWSPDGAHILADGPAGTFTLVATDGSPDQAIHVPVPLATIEQLFGARWSPDGDRIVFSMSAHRQSDYQPVHDAQRWHRPASAHR